MIDPDQLELLRSRQYEVDHGDWLILVQEMRYNASFYTAHKVPHQLEEFYYGGNPIHHLDVGPKNVRCMRREEGKWLEGVHWRGHCPALIKKEAEVEFMAKLSGSKKTEVKTASLGPKTFVADPAQTKVKSSKQPRDCSCDCGEMTNGGYFATGHDSKLKSLFLKVSREQVAKKDMTKKQMAMYAIWEKDKSQPVKEIAKQVWG